MASGGSIKLENEICLAIVDDPLQVTDADAANTVYVDESGQYIFERNGDKEMIVIQAPGTQQNQDSDQVLLRSNNGKHSTVTLVPSETEANGDVSYVLIVQNDGDNIETQTLVQETHLQEIEDEQEQDALEEENEPEEEHDPIDEQGQRDEEKQNVYDFDDEEREGEQNGDTEEDVKPNVKLLRAKSKKPTQSATVQNHLCGYCEYSSPKRYLLSRHMKSHSEERPHKCSVCERGFKTVASLQNHINTHTGTKPHLCKFCTTAFTTSGELVRHVRYKHTHEKPHKCTECNYASVELSKLKRHIRCHTGERPYQCLHCTYASPDTFKLKRHLRIHTGERPYKCDECDARFTQSNSLKSHKLTHFGDKPVFKCELCPATCGRKTDLRIHVQKLHMSEMPLCCKRCGKSFPDRYSYKVHSKTHEGEKCYKCELCPYASTTRRHLESHVLIHFDTKPFTCDLCPQAFRQRQLLKRHQNLYHNPEYVAPPPRDKVHDCSECGRAFRHKGNLIRHMALHDPESTVHERQFALKMGRKKKIQVIDGEQVELKTGDSDNEMEEDDEDDARKLVGLENELTEQQLNLARFETTSVDGQQYVVLEVIQFADDDDAQDNKALIGNALSEDAVIAALQNNGELFGNNQTQLVSVEDMKPGRSLKDDPHKSTQDEMKDCFGFDDDDDAESDDEETSGRVFSKMEME